MVEQKRSNKSKIAIALGLLLVIVVVVVMVSKSSSGANQEIYNQYFYAVKGPNIMQNDDSESGKLWVLATSAYDAADYKAARTHFGKLIETAPRQMNMLDLYYGISSMAIGKSHYKEANEIFKRIHEEGAGYANQAQWYLGLVNLAQGNTGKAKSIFKDIEVNDTHSHQKDAKGILARLNNPN